MEETISLKEIFEVLKKRILLILSIIVMATVISGVISFFFLTPIYQSSTQFLVNQEEKAASNSTYNVNDIRLNVEMINTYRDIIKSPIILDEVIDDMNLDLSTNELAQKFQLSNGQDSQVVTVTVTDPSHENAVMIANTVVEVFQDKVPDIMNVDNVQILSEAEEVTNPSPVKPSPMLNIAIAFVLGAMIGVGLAFLLEYLDNTIKDEQDIEKTLGLPVLGVISQVKPEDVTNPHSTRERNRTNSRSDSIGA
ncbi:YveK family protein [Pontibacillus salipaludis]|uniref:YveK family protein n=1 Tax=Pontibacillus salipaludis TaxID=1697394 RepID=UPI0031E86BF2